MWRFTVAAAVIASFFAITPVATALPLNEERTTAPAGGVVRRVVIESQNGSISVRSGATSAVKRTERWNYARPSYSQRYERGTLTIRTSCPQPDVLNNCSVDLSVTVPRTAEASVSNVNGDVTVGGLGGRSVAVETTNGPVLLRDLRSDIVRAQSTNGDIEASLLSGPSKAELVTDNGTISASVPSGAYAIRTETVNGHVAVDGLEDVSSSRRRLDARTTNGDIRLRGT